MSGHRVRPEADRLESRGLLTLLGQQLFPSDNPWNQNIASAPVAANSSAVINNIISLYGDGRFHPDFGQDTQSNNPLYGIPFNVVHGNTQPKVHVVVDGYPTESDLQDAPIPPNAVLEGDNQNSPVSGVANRGDSHLIVWDEDNNVAYEFFDTSRPSENADGQWHAAQESVWDMKTDTFRTLDWTSADAAGLAILPGLVRPDEALPVSQGGQGVIDHAIRITLQNNIILDQFIYPASHIANSGTNAAVQPPMGARLRLKAGVDISQLNPESKVIAQAMKDYGVIVADNGSNFFATGASYSVDANNNFALTWNDSDIQDSTHGLKSLTFSDFEVVNLAPVVTGLSTTGGAAGMTVTITGSNFSGAAGHLSVLFGGTAATNVTVVDDSHMTAVVPSGSGTVDVRVQSGVNEPDSENVNDPIFGYGTSAISAADRFTYSAGTSALIDNGSAGYSETGKWSPDPTSGYNGSYRYAAAGDGTTTATWQATGLATGDYDVQVTWQPYSNRATNAPYRIYDGTTLLQTVPVNQQFAPSGTMVGGTAFQRIATVHVNSGTLKVVLGNDANGYVIADAVRVTPASVATDLNWTGGGITGPTSIATDTNFTINRTYQITGAAPTADFTIVYYASADSTFGMANQVLLGSETITASADKMVGTHIGTSPAFQLHGAGTYYLYAVLDGSNTVAETDETNNLARAAQTVAASGALVIDNGAVGYTETGVWSSAADSGYHSNYRYAAAGDGSTTATWQATGLATGSYDVQVTWPAYSNRATNAPYRIYDGTTLLQTVRVNQQASPAGTVLGGVAFQRIATVRVTSGTLKIVLGNDANAYVIADAARVAPASIATDLNWTGGGITGPTSIATDTNFTVSRAYQITGAAPTADFTISYYASPDATFGTVSQVPLGSETITAAADKTVGTHTGSSPVFQLHGAGTYYLYAVLDSGNAVVETDETNNVAQAPQTAVALGAVLIDNGTAGYTEAGAWSSASDSGFNGGYRYAPAGDGTTTATWQATGLATGDYDVEVTWPAYPNRATNAPYSVYNGTTLLQTVLVNQQAAPIGPTYGGVVFLRLGTFHVTSGTLKVVLANNANGYVTADAARIAVSSAPAIDLNWTGGGVTAPSATTTDATFTVSRTYQITGAAPTSDFTIAYYASTDSTFGNADDVLIGTETITAAADKTVGTHAGTSPALQIRLPGTYTIFAKLDANDAVRETDETNNVAQAAPQPVASGASFVDNVDAGYSEAGAWYGAGATTSGYNGSYRYAPSGSGNSTATWQVGGLASGSYEVDVTWVAYSNRATNAPYSVYDGSTLLKTVMVDQTKVPSGTSYTGVPFQSLGVFTVSSGTLRVVLSNNANSWVIADAVRIAVAGAAPAVASSAASPPSAAFPSQRALSSLLRVDATLARWDSGSAVTLSAAATGAAGAVIGADSADLTPILPDPGPLPVDAGAAVRRKKS